MNKKDVEAYQQGEKRRQEYLELLNKKQKKDSRKLDKEIKKGEKIESFKFKCKGMKSGTVCMTIPQHIQSADMIAYCWDNANMIGGGFSEYEYFKIYDNPFQLISAKRDINKGVWNEEFNNYVAFSKEQFLAELKLIYCTLLELNMKRFKNNKKNGYKLINLFYRSILKHLQKHSRYDFNRLYVLGNIKKWRVSYLMNPKRTLLELEKVLAGRGRMLKQRDFKLKEGLVIEQLDNEYNSFLSRLYEDKKRHSIQKLFNRGVISEIRNGYLTPIMADDLNLCEKTHKDIKLLVNEYNQELTGGTDNRHLDNYVEVAEYVAECFDVYMRFEKMCKSTDTLYISTNIECPNIYTRFVESKYFPKVGDVVRELNINNRRSIAKSIQALKRPIDKAVQNAKAILMLMHAESYEIKNIKTNGKNRLAIVPIENFDSDALIKKKKIEEINRTKQSLYLHLQERFSNQTQLFDLKDLFDNYKVDYNASLEYYRDNNFDVIGWSGSEVMPQLIQKSESEDLLELVRDIEQSCSSVIKLDSKQVKLSI